MSDADRERDLRRLERDRRRREEGQAAYFARSESLYSWPLLTDVTEQPTMMLPTSPPRDLSSAAEPDRRRLAVSGAIFAVATGMSRIFGLVREVIAAYYFGASGKVNAFTVAFQLPNLVRALVADAALSSAFVPVFSELLEKGDRKRAWRVASSLFWLMLLGLTGLTVIFIFVAPWIIELFGNPGHDKALAVGLSRVLFPIVTLLGVSGIVVGILNSYDHFTVPAISPVFWNLAIIAGLAIGVPQAHSMNTKLYIYAVSILIATVIQVLLPIPWLRGRDGKLQLVLDWRDPAVRRVFVLMVPVTLGLGLINVNAVIDTFFASRFVDANLAPTAIQKAFLVYMLPQGMFSVAIATVLFPSLSRFATRGDIDGFRELVSTGLRQIAFLLVPAAVVSAVFSEPIIRILFQHGHWNPADTPTVAGALAAFSAGLVFNGAMLMLNRAFFSLQSNWIPTVIALGNLFLNAILDYAFYRLGVWGIPLGTAVCNIAATWALLVLMRRRLGRLDGGKMAWGVARVMLASVIAAGVSYGIWKPLDSALGHSFGTQAVSLGLGLAAAIVTYLISCRAMRVHELDTLASLWGRGMRP